MAKDRINWDLIEEFKKKEEFLAIWKPYGLPEITDPITTAFGSVAVQPPWDIPEKIVISCAITGAFYSQRANPYHHLLPEDIIASGEACAQAGAPTVHFHFRDKDGYNVLDPAMYDKYLPPLKAKFPEVVYDGCLVPFQQGEWDKMIQVLDAGHLEVTPINTVAAYCGDTLFCKPPHVMIEKTRLCQERGIKCQVAVYSDGDIDNADRYLIKTGLLEKPYYWIILPNPTGWEPDAEPAADGVQPHASCRCNQGHRRRVNHRGLCSWPRLELSRDPRSSPWSQHSRRERRHGLQVASQGRPHPGQRRTIPRVQDNRRAAREKGCDWKRVSTDDRAKADRHRKDAGKGRSNRHGECRIGMTPVARSMLGLSRSFCLPRHSQGSRGPDGTTSVVPSGVQRSSRDGGGCAGCRDGQMHAL